MGVSDEDDRGSRFSQLYRASDRQRGLARPSQSRAPDRNDTHVCGPLQPSEDRVGRRQAPDRSEKARAGDLQCALLERFANHRAPM
jgi:hypothetical protein